MTIEIEHIKSLFSSSKELVRLLPLINDIAIIEYDGKNIDGCRAVHQFICENNLSCDAVNRVILLGKKGIALKQNCDTISTMFPSAQITMPNKTWKEIVPHELNVRNTLVIHMPISIGITNHLYDIELGDGKHFINFAKETRLAYDLCVISKKYASHHDNRYELKHHLRLADFSIKHHDSTNPLTKFCQDKRDYITTFLKNTSEESAFFQCVEESEQGCEECSECNNYGTRKRCPYALRAVAKFYREGKYVPRDERIAHQWEIMAARQEYKPAIIQVADDLCEGFGGEKDVEKALHTYRRYASSFDSEHCINQILKIAEEHNINKLVAIPYIVLQAMNGNEDMIIKLSDAFQNGEYGLPKDMIQQKEWIEQGAKNGNPRFVKAMAEMYESNQDWQQSYKWYSTLAEVAPEMSDKDKLETIELRMLTNGASPEDVTVAGENYLYGHFGTERDLHLAYRCLKYGSENHIAKAKGLLGVMYLEGLKVEKDEDYAIKLLTEAAEEDDLFSMVKLTDLEYYRGPKWERFLTERIDDEVKKNIAYALYLKGLYLLKGRLYDQNFKKAFDYMFDAARKNLPIAQYKLYEMYEDGNGIECNIELSKRWLKISADNGYYLAQGKYGMLLFENMLSFDDTKEQAFKYLKPAYDQGYEDVCWCLAQCYMFGYGTKTEKKHAYPLYKKAAESGIAAAQETLCEKYYRGDGAFLPQSYDLCAKWGELAIVQGCKSIRFETAYSLAEIGKTERAKELYLELCNEGIAVAMNNYACLLPDTKEKVEWYLKSAEKGENYGMWNAARQYKKGGGVEKNIDKAIKLFEKAANNGNIGAMLDLASMYRDGDCVPIDGERALRWYTEAANEGDVNGLLGLAYLYHAGKIVKRNIKKAIHYYKLAAEQDNPRALFCLGKLYENGTGVAQNTLKAIYWYRKAAIKGNNNAKEKLKQLKTNWNNDNGDIEDNLIFDDI